MVMIDWVDFLAPLEHDQSEKGPFYNGEVIAIKPDRTSENGCSIEWQTQKRMSVEGSYSSTIQIKSSNMLVGQCPCQAIWVSGNPAKFFQGHNVFGTDDLGGLVRAMLEFLVKQFDLKPSDYDRTCWEHGFIDLLRVDVTGSYDFGNLGRVRAALRALDSTATMKYRGRGHYRGDTLTFGEGSRRSSFTFYSKGAELQKHKLPFTLQGSPVEEIAQGWLRSELRLRSMELKERQLNTLNLWGKNTPSELHSATMKTFEFAEATMIETETIEGLPYRLQRVYKDWKDGVDLRQVLARPTFYRYRSELKEFGVDISIKQDAKEVQQSNVVPLKVVLHGYPVGIPDWAKGTPYLFEPSKQSA